MTCSRPASAWDVEKRAEGLSPPPARSQHSGALKSASQRRVHDEAIGHERGDRA